MKNKLFLTILMMIFVSSCSNEEVQLRPDGNIIELKFDSDSKSGKNTIDGKNTINYKTYSATIISLSPLVIESEYLEVIEFMNSETNEMAYVIVEKQNDQKNLNLYGRIDGCTASIEKGYWYDGYDCFIYGTIVTDSNCNRAFIPSSVATQVLMNECGWSDVA